MKEVVLSLSPSSAPGPDRMSGRFYHFCWDIISADLFNMVCDFFAGTEIPKSLTHTCLILLPKVTSPQRFTDMRHISLSNFSYKIISKLLNSRLSNVIQKVVSPNQEDFLKYRSIIENIMLTQELVYNIKKKPNVNGNVVVKLDMTKTFDRVDWKYLCQLLRQVGFSEYWIDMIWRLLTNNWYSININGGRHSFFKSGRGIK